MSMIWGSASLRQAVLAAELCSWVTSAISPSLWHQPPTSGQGEGEFLPLEGVDLVKVALLDDVGGASAALDDLPAVDAELNAGARALQQWVLHGEPQGVAAPLVKLGTDHLKLKIQGLLLSLQPGALQGRGDARLPCLACHGDDRDGIGDEPSLIAGTLQISALEQALLAAWSRFLS